MPLQRSTPDPGPPSAELPVAEIFTQLWNTLADLLGSAAAATLLRRSIKRVNPPNPELTGISIERDRFEYRYVLPQSWYRTDGSLDALRSLTRELRPLLFELTGTVVINRLLANPKLARCGLFSEEQPS